MVSAFEFEDSVSFYQRLDQAVLNGERVTIRFKTNAHLCMELWVRFSRCNGFEGAKPLILDQCFGPPGLIQRAARGIVWVHDRYTYRRYRNYRIETSAEQLKIELIPI